MDDSSQILRKEVAWNGIRFLSPRKWEVGKIGPRYLLLEDESGPVMEVKWRRVKGTFSHEAHLRRLGASHGKRPGKSLKERPVPAEWEKVLENFETTGFSWRGTSLGGVGVILYCPTCRNASLIQFYQRDSNELQHIYQSILASFQDHRQDDQVIWSLFDIRALIPKQFNLMHHRLESGQFELAFESKGQQITLHRWGPAAIILGNKDLTEFAETVIDTLGVKPHSITRSGNNIIEWQVTPSSSRWKRLWQRMKTRHPFRCYRLWHLKEKNRILGISAVGKKPFDTRFLELIFNGYENL